MPDNSDDHFRIFIWRLVTRHDNFCTGQVLQLVYLERQKTERGQAHPSKANTWAVEGDTLGMRGKGRQNLFFFFF